MPRIVSRSSMFTRRSSSSSTGSNNVSDLSLLSQYYPSTESERRYDSSGHASGRGQNYFFQFDSQRSSEAPSLVSSGRSTPSMSGPPSPIASVNVPQPRRHIMSSRRKNSLPPTDQMQWLSTMEQQQDSWGQFVDPAAADEEIERIISSRRRSVR